MKLILEINITADRRFFRAYSDDNGLESITGSGWTVMDAIDDFLEAFNRDAFFDDDTPSVIRRREINLTRVLRSGSSCNTQKRP